MTPSNGKWRLAADSAVALLAAAVLALALASCGKADTSSKNSHSGASASPSDGSTTESAVSAIEDLINPGDLSSTGGVAMVPGARRPTVAWYERLLPEQTAWANSFSCSGPNWGGSGNAITLTPGACTYTNGTTSWTVSWSGQFLFTYDGTGACVGGDYGSVDSSLPAGCVITRTTDPTVIRTVSHGSASYEVTHDTQNPSGWDSTVSTDGNGVVITCGATGCPGLDDTGAKTRSVAIGGSHLTGTLNGVTFWNHTVSTDPSDPLVIQGSGQYRVVQSGTVIVQHNLVHVTARVTVASALVHAPDCAYPVGGKLIATFSTGRWSGGTETLEFGSNCGEATLTKSDGSSGQDELSQ